MSKVPYSTTFGDLMYSMVCARLDIVHAVGVVRMYMNNPCKDHWKEVQWILRYLRGTTSHALCFGGLDTILQGYVDANMAGDKDNRRSTTGYVFTVGGTTVSWISKLQQVVALSTTKAEYVAATEASKEMIQLQRFMEELGKKQEKKRSCSRLLDDKPHVLPYPYCCGLVDQDPSSQDLRGHLTH